MTTNEGRCEPPPEWRDRDGWHWVQAPVGDPHLARWHAAERDDVEPLWTSTHHVYSGTPRYAVREWGWRYVAPVTPPATVAALEAERDDWKRLCTIAEPEVAALRQEVQRAGKACFDAQQETVFYRAEVARMKKAASTINEEVCQTLGAALGYPWFKDDQTNFPGATETDGVCVGPHVAESLAAEAAAKLATVAALVEALEGLERMAVAAYRAMSPAGNIGEENAFADNEPAIKAARAALALYRGEAGR